MFPNYEIYLFFVVPIRVKWLALLTFAFVAFQFVVGSVGAKAAIAIALANYLLFFGGHLVRLARGQQLQMRQATRRTQFRSERPSPAKEAVSRACAICGARQEDGADIRVCSCEKCGAPRELCLEHARQH